MRDLLLPTLTKWGMACLFDVLEPTLQTSGLAFRCSVLRDKRVVFAAVFCDARSVSGFVRFAFGVVFGV